MLVSHHDARRPVDGAPCCGRAVSADGSRPFAAVGAGLALVALGLRRLGRPLCSRLRALDVAGARPSRRLRQRQRRGRVRARSIVFRKASGLHGDRGACPGRRGVLEGGMAALIRAQEARALGPATRSSCPSTRSRGEPVVRAAEFRAAPALTRGRLEWPMGPGRSRAAPPRVPIGGGPTPYCARGGLPTYRCCRSRQRLTNTPSDGS